MNKFIPMALINLIIYLAAMGLLVPGSSQNLTPGSFQSFEAYGQRWADQGHSLSMYVWPHRKSLVNILTRAANELTISNQCSSSLKHWASELTTQKEWAVLSKVRYYIRRVT